MGSVGSAMQTGGGGKTGVRVHCREALWHHSCKAEQGGVVVQCT